MRKPLTDRQAMTRAKAIAVHWMEGFCEIPDPDKELTEADEAAISGALRRLMRDLERGAHHGFLEKIRSDGAE